MTPDRLAALLEDRLPDVSWPPVEEPIDLLRALEVAADSNPQDRVLGDAVVEVHGLVTVGQMLPPIIAGVRRERIVRWDHWTVTWEGTRLQSGGTAMVRTLRSHAAKDPVLRRQIARDGRALRSVLPQLEIYDGPNPALVISLPGPIAVSGNYATKDIRIRARTLRRVLGELHRWNEAGLGLPRLGLTELRDTTDVIEIICLSPTRNTDAANLMCDVATLLDPQDEGGDSPIDALVSGFRVFPPNSYEEAKELWAHALSAHLQQARQDLARRAVEVGKLDRHMRLHQAVEALHKAVPPPTGRGHIGVNLEGVPTIVESTGDSVWWGPVDGELVAVFSPLGGFAPRDARRLLRARASAPPNARLSKEVGGDPAVTEDVCKWVGAGMQLRTIRLLLQATM